MAESKTANLVVETIVSLNKQADTGHAAGWVALRTQAGAALSPALDAIETPAGSGNYVCTWNPATYGVKWGYWYINNVAATTAPVYLGLIDGRSTRIFYNVTVFNSADTPSGAVGAPKTLVTGSGALATDSEGRSDFNFVNPPAVAFCNKQTRLAVQIGLVTVSGGNATIQVSVTDDGDNYDATTCKADIVLYSRD